MLHYHGTPITPAAVLYSLAGNCFCVSHMRPDQVRQVHEIGQSVLLDNGAYSKWKSKKSVDWPAYYEWADLWLSYPTTWAIIPDEIEGGSQEQDALIREWPHGERGAPVWHMDESLERLWRLADEWPRVCIGANGEYAKILSAPFCRRMDAAWNGIANRHQRTPWLHMLRGMQLARREWPFASVDSTDVAQNHNRPRNVARVMADRWNAANGPSSWRGREAFQDLFEEQAA
jgi:hypothetical protein